MYNFEGVSTKILFLPGSLFALLIIFKDIIFLFFLVFNTYSELSSLIFSNIEVIFTIVAN